MAATPKPGSVVHVEIHSTAPEKTQAFYERVFGWKFQAIPEMNYTTFDAPSPPGGGLQAAAEMGPMILNYLLSTDVAADLRKVQDAGGSVLVPKSEIPGMGWFAIFRDPTGLSSALYEAMKKAPAARAKPKKRSAKKARRSRK